MSRRIKLQADYSSSPLWDVDNPDNLSLETFNLSDELRARLERWAEEYDQRLNRDNPGDKTPAPPEVIKAVKARAKAFDKEGALMWLELRKELKGEYEVGYFLSGYGILTDPKELEQFDFWKS
ncbi:hypothetical protein IQ241_10205 [Romeria aff. gracilis LEGE 07310]|uniref:Uncharacterized protein n=1 Tax=Vasconcelosia minhoensis LEGE 07310 TaxID=915328 RepID=A0A8J7AND0_9CYAN|nr:hypothetical protein [Romeria gracilis]MBE9077664.1 hypothetical protein [Romeria aff. gracilis LEGE 07310]